jgi:acetyl-CoA C-acetyltransferase
MSRIAIIEAKRTPIGNFLGGFRNMSAVELGVSVVKAVVECAGLQPADVDEVIFGMARQAGSGPNPARQISHGAGIPWEKPSFTVNMACASGMKTIALGVESILFGRSSCVLVGGAASMTRLPDLLEGGRM